MIVKNISEFTNGWFIGNFDPSIFKNEYFEVAHHRHPAGYKTPDRDWETFLTIIF